MRVICKVGIIYYYVSSYTGVCRDSGGGRKKGEEKKIRRRKKEKK
jgi:hypothetical protein